MVIFCQHQTDESTSNSLSFKTPRLKPKTPCLTAQKPLIQSQPLSQVKKGQKLRIALYSHDTMGLGHKRRNLLIAQSLGLSPLNADILLISGMSDLTKVETHPEIESITLPALHKTPEGQYQARHLGMSLKEIIKLRSQVIRTTLKNFQPDVFIVDNVPRGAMGELNRTLKYLKRQGKTRCILGLRDILDQPEVIRHSWQQANNEEAIRRYYDAVWVYGDPVVYNLIDEYQFAPDIAAKVCYTGYLDQRCRLQYAKAEVKQPLHLSKKQLVLCLVGGGQDGGHLAQTFVQADFPPNTQAILVTGPLMPLHLRQKLQDLAKNRPDLQILDYVAEPTWLVQQADQVISMGGYNTTCEILSFEKTALIIPRIQPRQEQLIRAQRLQQLGLVDMLHPNQVTPQAISKWLSQEITIPKVHQQIDFQGLQRIPLFLAKILDKTDYLTLKVS